MEHVTAKKFEQHPAQTETRVAPVIDLHAMRQTVREQLRPRVDDHRTAHLMNERIALQRQREVLEADRDFEAAHEHQLTLQDAERARSQHEHARARHDDSAQSMGAFSKMMSAQFGELAQLQMRMTAHRATYEKQMAHAKMLEGTARRAAQKRTALKEITARIAAIDDEMEMGSSSVERRTFK